MWNRIVLFLRRNPEWSFIFFFFWWSGGCHLLLEEKIQLRRKKKLIFIILLYLPIYTHSGKVWKSRFYVRTQAKEKKITVLPPLSCRCRNTLTPPLRRIGKHAAVLFAAQTPATAFLWADPKKKHSWEGADTLFGS